LFVVFCCDDNTKMQALEVRIFAFGGQTIHPYPKMGLYGKEVSFRQLRLIAD